MQVENGSSYENGETMDGKPVVVGPMKTGGWPGFATDQKGFLYLHGSYFMSDRPERNLVRKVLKP